MLILGIWSATIEINCYVVHERNFLDTFIHLSWGKVYSKFTAYTYAGNMKFLRTGARLLACPIAGNLTIHPVWRSRYWYIIILNFFPGEYSGGKKHRAHLLSWKHASALLPVWVQRITSFSPFLVICGSLAVRFLIGLCLLDVFAASSSVVVSWANPLPGKRVGSGDAG